MAARSPPLSERERELGAKGGLAAAGRTEHGQARAPLDSAPQERVECADAAGNLLLRDPLSGPDGAQLGIDLDAPGADAKVVIAAAVGLAPKLRDIEPAAGRAVVAELLLQAQDPPGETARVQQIIAAELVRHQRGAAHFAHKPLNLLHVSA
jgi:hypothetical protein